VILVTGGTGFIGRHLVARLRAAEPAADVRLLSRRPLAAAEPGIELVGDVTEPADVDRAMAGASVVYHLAGRVSRNPADAAQLYRLHVEGTRNVCWAARVHRPSRLVVVSTSGILAVSEIPTVHDEGSGYKVELVGRWPYYASKLFAEKLALDAAARFDLPLVVVNPSLVLGPGGGPESTNRDVALFLAGRIPVIPRGGLSFVDVRDLATALVAAARVGRPGERYLLGAANWTFRELAGWLSRLSGAPVPRLHAPSTPLVLAGTRVLRPLLGLAGRAFEPDDVSIDLSAHFWYVDASKARAELGFRPRDPVETLRDTTNDLRRSDLVDSEPGGEGEPRP